MSGFQVQQLKHADGDTVTKFPTRLGGRNAWLVAFSLTMGDPNAEQRKFFNQLWGKPAEARISIFEPEPSEGDRNNSKQRYSLHSQGEVYDVRPWFGKKAWFVPKQRIHVQEGLGHRPHAADLGARARHRPSEARALALVEKAGSAATSSSATGRARISARSRSSSACTARRACLFTALVVKKTPESKNR